VRYPDGAEEKHMSKLTIIDQRLQPIAERVLAGERLRGEDGIALYRSPDLLAVGWLANYVREKRHGNVTYFNVNRHINPTNVCVAHCKLCAFGRSPEAPGALGSRPNAHSLQCATQTLVGLMCRLTLKYVTLPCRFSRT